MAEKLKGDCFLCGESFSKAEFAKHILKAHQGPCDDPQDCLLLKVEGAEDENYWLYLDIAASASLKTLDTFLRKIWVECCGHLSAFFTRRRGELGKARKMSSLPEGAVFCYEYDFGSTTELMITVVGFTQRPKQRAAVRLLGRNQPFTFKCHDCGKAASLICTECMWEDDNPFYCKVCADKHEQQQEHEMFLPIVNSPRMGECGYCGELDEYQFDPQKFSK